MKTITEVIEAYGTIGTKKTATEQGKDPDLTFERQVVAYLDEADSGTIIDLANTYAELYDWPRFGPKEYSQQTGPDLDGINIEWFIDKCNKHLKDNHRRIYKQGPSKRMTPLQKQVNDAMKAKSPEEQLAMIEALREKGFDV